MKLYRVLLETQNKAGIKHIPRYVMAETINEAWDKANTRGAEFNETHRNKCVVYSVNLLERLGAETTHPVLRG